MKLAPSSAERMSCWNGIGYASGRTILFNDRVSITTVSNLLAFVLFASIFFASGSHFHTTGHGNVNGVNWLVYPYQGYFLRIVHVNSLCNESYKY